MNNTSRYYKSLADTYRDMCGTASTPNRVPGASDQLARIYEEQYGVSGKGREHDEPTEPRKTQYLSADKRKYDADMKIWKQRNQSAMGKERLKRKGAVPIKSGKRLFEDFMMEANQVRGKKSTEELKMSQKAKQIYLSARSLEYDKWVIFVSQMLPKY